MTTNQEFENALLAEGQRKIIQRFNMIELHTRPKTTTEIIDEMRQVSTPQEWQKVVDARIETASFEQCAKAVAESQGMTLDEFVNPSGQIMKKLVQDINAEEQAKDDEMNRKLNEKQRLLQQVNTI